MLGAWALLAGAAAVGRVTWQRLWRDDATPYGRLVYHYGVKWFGLSMWIVTSSVVPERLAQHQSELSLWWLGLAVLVYAVTSFPLALWGGYLWGRAMALFFGISR